MSDDEEREKIYRTLIHLWQDHFFREPKNFLQTYEEMTRPSITSADTSYDKKLVSQMLRQLVKEGILSVQGSAFENRFVEARSPQGFSRW